MNKKERINKIDKEKGIIKGKKDCYLQLADVKIQLSRHNKVLDGTKENE